MTHYLSSPLVVIHVASFVLAVHLLVCLSLCVVDVDSGDSGGDTEDEIERWASTCLLQLSLFVPPPFLLSSFVIRSTFCRSAQS